MSGQITPQDIQKLTTSEKIQLAVALKREGWHVDAIATHFGCCQKTIYNYLTKARDERLNELEAVKSIDILVENLDAIENLEDLCLKMASQIASEHEVDPVTGEIKPKKGSYRDKAEFLRLVRDFRKMKIDLEVKTGVLPNSADQIYRILQEQHAKAQSSDEEAKISRPELEAKLKERLQNQAWI